MKEPRKSPPNPDERLDAELDGTFPASDPPSYTSSIFAGGPARAQAGRSEDRASAGKRPGAKPSAG